MSTLNVNVRHTDLRRAYVHEHPLALWFSLGAVLTGIPLLLAPFLGEGSSALAVLPDWAVVAWAGWYGLGGLASACGMIFLKGRLEAAGMALLSSALGVTVATIIAARGFGAALSVAFLGTLAIGCANRAWFLATRDRWTR